MQHFFVLFSSLLSRLSLLHISLSLSLSLSLFLLVTPTLAFCIVERRIGSLNKMTRLFIGAFVRVKVGITILFGRRPMWISLCEHFARGWSEVSKSGAFWLIGRRKLRCAVYFLFMHFRARSSFTLSRLWIPRGIYEVMSKPSPATPKIAIRGLVGLLVCLIIIVIRLKFKRRKKDRDKS